MGTYYSYTCNSCGKYQASKSSVRRCNFCQMLLCRKCQKKGFCPKHSQILSLAEQKEIHGAYQQMDASCGIGIFLCFVTLIGMVILFGSFSGGTNQTLSTAGGWIGAIAGVVIAILVNRALGTKAKIKYHDAIQRALTRLNAEGHPEKIDTSPVPKSGAKLMLGTAMQKPPAAVPQGTVPVGAQGRKCPSCGASMSDPTAEFCANCGGKM